MCLFINVNFHKKKGKIVSLVAKQSILVYKVLESDGKHYETPYECMPINFDDEYGMFFYKTTKFRVESALFGLGVGSCIGYEVTRGIHSYTTLDDAKDCVENLNKCFHSNASLHYAIIPKGSRFYIGKYGDIASSNLVVFKNKTKYSKNKMYFGDKPIELSKYLEKFGTELDSSRV